MGYNRRHFRVSAIVLLLAGVAQAYAQDDEPDFLLGEKQGSPYTELADQSSSSPQAGAATKSAGDRGVINAITGAQPQRKVIEEIVVTATKRATRLQDTSIAITALQSEDLALRDIRSLSDMQNNVPNMQFGDVGGVPMVAIRGAGFNLGVGFGEPGVAVHVDNVFLPRLGTTNTAGMDMQRIEVLRGPQGTLYGRNATGGAANFVSAAPTGQFEAGFSLGAGSFDRRTYEGYASGPLTDWMRGRLYVLKDMFDGYGVNEFNGHRISGNDTQGVRGALAFDVTNDISLDLNLYNRIDEGTVPATRPAKGTGVTSVLGVPVPEEDVRVRGSNQNMNADKDPYTRRETTLGIATLSWTFDALDFKSITAFVDHTSLEDYDVDSTSQFILNGIREEEANSFSQEFNFSGDLLEEKMDWLLGFAYMNDEGFSRFTATFNADALLGVVQTPTGSNLVLDVLLEDQANVAKAVFGEMSWRFSDNLKFLVGARYSVETKRGLQSFTARLDTSGSTLSSLAVTLSPAFNLLPLAGTPLEGLQGGSIDPLLNQLLEPVLAQAIQGSCERQLAEITNRSFDPKFELSWEPNANTLVYLQNQSGFKAGGITHGNCGEVYVPEEVNSTELGFKTSVLDNRLVLNGALFTYQYKDYQVFEFDGLQALVINAPKASGTGAELEINYAPVDWMSTDAALSWLDAEYDEFVDEDGFENPNILLATAQPQDLSGNPLNRAPSHTANLGLNFYIPVDLWGSDLLSLRGEVYYSDSIAFTQFAPQKATDRQAAFTTYNLYAALSSERNGWQLRGFVKNVTDEEYLSGVFPLDLLHLTLHTFAPPRTSGVELSYIWR